VLQMCCSVADVFECVDEYAPLSFYEYVYVAACCSVLQRVAASHSVLQRVAAWCRVMSLRKCVAVCCSVLQCVAVCCSVADVFDQYAPLSFYEYVCVAACCSVLHHVAAMCSVLQGIVFEYVC